LLGSTHDMQTQRIRQTLDDRSVPNAIFTMLALYGLQRLCSYLTEAENADSEPVSCTSCDSFPYKKRKPGGRHGVTDDVTELQK